MKGIAYSGALAVLEQRGILRRIKRVGGTSAGAINASLLALGYSLGEIRDILANLDFRNFMDDDWGVLRDAKRLVRDFGWYKGDFFRQWMAHLVEAKTGNPDSTFADLAKRRGKPKLHLVATNLATRLSQVYSKDHSPALPVADAVRRSMSIPLFFASVRESGNLFVDGGVLDNYPIRLFDREKYVAKRDRKRHTTKPPHYAEDNQQRRGNTSPFVYNRETLGFRLDSREEIALFRDGAAPKPERIDDFFELRLGTHPDADGGAGQPPSAKRRLASHRVHQHARRRHHRLRSRRRNQGQARGLGPSRHRAILRVVRHNRARRPPSQPPAKLRQKQHAPWPSGGAEKNRA